MKVEPDSALIDDDVTISGSGLQPRCEVTLVVETEERGQKFYSCGHYVTDDAGALDVSKMAALGGTYTGEWDANLSTI